MNTFHDWLNDSDGDGIPDDMKVRLVLDLPDGNANREFWAHLLDLTAVIGLNTAALPLPLVQHDGRPAEPGHEVVSIRSLEQIQEILPPTTSGHRDTGNHQVSACLSKFLTIDGALSDRDGDRIADGTAFRFSLPDDMPVSLGAALANLSARIGLESGGIDLPLIGDSAITFSIKPSDGPARVESTGNGWIAAGDPDEVADLINRIAGIWPHVTLPESGGVGYSLGWLRRSLAGDGPERQPSGALEWELQWSAACEVNRIWAAFSEQLFSQLRPEDPLRLTIMASEPRNVRRKLAGRIEAALAAAGFLNAKVETICTFKSGLSWLREVVIPSLVGKQAGRIEIGFRRYEADADSLDLPIRWLQELFPGDEILARDLHIDLDAISLVENAAQDATYRATAFTADGETIDTWDFTPLSRTIPFVQAIPGSGTVCVTTSGLIAEQGEHRIEIPVRSDLESFWTFWQGEVIPRLLTQIEDRGGARRSLQPFFERLEAEVWISEPNSRLGVREENDSAAEALHEDIYFNTLDAIETYGERQTGEKTSAPGAVVPVVHPIEGGTPHARVRLFGPPETSALPYPDVSIRKLTLRDNEFLPEVLVENGSENTAARLIALAAMPRESGTGIPARVRCGDITVELRLPLQETVSPSNSPDKPPTMHENIHSDAVLHNVARVAAYPEVTAWIEDYSYQRRPLVALAISPAVAGRLRSPAKLSALKPTALIVARHHANEISSTNAAFNLAYLCATDPDWHEIARRVNIILIPYENPDGAALHARLASTPATANWKHHPARYNALGTEFSEAFHDPDTRFGESRVRPALWRRFLPDAVVDNHGVPSHEWVQPFAGFGSPPRFRVSYWIPQALLYGIIGFVESDDFPEHGRMAKALRDGVSNAVRDTDIGQLNDEIGRSYRVWGQDREPDRFPGEFHNGMLWHISGAPPGDEGRGFSTRYPATTVLNWVTEVNDETATGDHLERTARAHLVANRAMLDLLATSAAIPDVVENNGSWRWHRKRPLDVGRDQNNEAIVDR